MIVVEPVEPVQVTPALVYDGVTTIVPTAGEVPVFKAVKEEISPEPLAARPIAVVLFVQLKTVPGTAPVKESWFVVPPLHLICAEIEFTVGIVFTVTVVEAQPTLYTQLL